MVYEMTSRLFPTSIIMIIIEVLLKVMREEMIQNRNLIQAKEEIENEETLASSDQYFSNPSGMVDKIMTFLAL